MPLFEMTFDRGHGRTVKRRVSVKMTTLRALRRVAMRLWRDLRSCHGGDAVRVHAKALEDIPGRGFPAGEDIDIGIVP